MAWSAAGPTIDFYHQGADSVVFAEWSRLWADADPRRRRTLSRLLAKLAHVQQHGVRQPDDDQEFYLEDIAEWVFAFGLRDVQMFYAARRHGLVGGWQVVALHFRLATARPDDEATRMVGERLRRWRATAGV